MKRSVLGALCVGAAAVSVSTFGTAIASAADDYTGMTYSDAKAALSKANEKGVIATRSGDQLSDDKCTVTHWQKAAWVKGDAFATVTDTVLLNLSCDAGVASATKAGNSAASPEGRKAIAADDAAAKKKAADDAAAGT